LGVLKPGAHEKVAAMQPSGTYEAGGTGNEPFHLLGERQGYAFVGIEKQNPLVPKFHRAKACVFLRGVVIELPLVDKGAKTGCDLDGLVAAEGVKDVDVIRPGNGGKAT